MWKKALPSVHPFYAVKCNTDPTLLSWLKQKGACFDCASSREMNMVSKFYNGNIWKNILFANPCKTPQDIQLAKELRIPWVTVDSVEELEKMNEANYRPEIVIRLRVDDTGSTSPFSLKFGADYEQSKYIAKIAKEMKMLVVGMSFHVGSGSDRPEAFREAIHLANTSWNAISTRRMDVLDLGGGWSYEEKLFTEQSKATLEGLKSCDAKNYIAEPGRFFAAPVYDLYIQVIGKKPNTNGWRYTLDESIYGQFSCIPYDHATPSMGVLRETNGVKTKAILFGRTCDSLDWIANSVSMDELEVGDWLYIPNMGAYTTSTSTEFNGFPKPEIIKIDDMPSTVSWLDVSYPLAKMLSVQSTNMS